MTETLPTSAKGVVCVDFDGTLRPWGGLFDDPDPLPGAKGFMDKLRERDFQIVVFTSRLSPQWHRDEERVPAIGAYEQLDYIEWWLNRHGIPFDDITAEKVPAEAYIDDRAFRFENWEATSKEFFGETP